MIYLDNAATSLHRPDCVVQAVAEAMNGMGNCGRGAHAASLAAGRTIHEARSRIDRLFHGYGAQQVAFTANSTAALNIAISSLLAEGGHAIATALDHNSVLRPLYRSGAELTILPADEKGRLSLDGLETAFRPDTKLVVCTHASNVTGDLVDIGRIGAACAAHGVPFVLDASQTAGCFAIDMQAMGIDVLCFTGHKGLLGPQGTGGLCVSPRLRLSPLCVGGSGVHSFDREHPAQMPTALEAGTLNGHGIAGLAAALEWLEETGLDTIRRREQALAGRFYQGVKDLPGVKCYGDFSTTERSPIVALNLGDWDSSLVSDELAQRFGILTRPGAHCAPLIHEAMGTVAQGAVRFSFGYFNTKEDVDAAIRAVDTLCREEA